MYLIKRYCSTCGIATDHYKGKSSGCADKALRFEEARRRTVVGGDNICCICGKGFDPPRGRPPFREHLILL